MNNNLSIGILNGGNSKRMGRAKSLVLYQKLPVIEYIYNEALKISKNVFILGSGETTDKLKKVRKLKDSNFPGPLGGVISAIELYDTDWFFWAVDMPLLNHIDILRLLNYKSNFPLAIIPYYKDIKIYEPYFAYYSRELLIKIKKLLTEDQDFFSMQRVLKYFQIKGNETLGKELRSKLKSWNYPEDIL